MSVRLVRGRRCAAAAACFLVVSVGGLAGCGAGPAASEPTERSHPTTGPAGPTVRVLQLNLCNSGRADCYSGGRAVSRAAALIREHLPHVVTLNEICRDDLDVLQRALATASPRTEVASAFRSALDRPTQTAVRCRNGQEFGDGVLVAATPPAAGSRTSSGVYPVQADRDPEGRVWVCIDVATQFSACTTHATSGSATAALEQCRHLLETVVSGIRSRNGGRPVVIGADLNLASHGSPNPGACLPSGYRRADDDLLQDVIASPGTDLRSRSVIDMQGATDHPGLLVDVVLPRQ